MKRVKTETGFCEPETKVTKIQDFANTTVTDFQQKRLKEAMDIVMSLFQKNIGRPMTHKSFIQKLEGFIEIKAKHTCVQCMAGLGCAQPDLCKLLSSLRESDIKRNNNLTERLERNPYKELYNRWMALSPTDLEQKQCFQLLADAGFLRRQVNDKKSQDQQKWKWVHVEKDATAAGQFQW